MTDAEEEIMQIEGELQEAESDLGDTLSDVRASGKAAVDRVRLVCVLSKSSRTMLSEE